MNTKLIHFATACPVVFALSILAVCCENSQNSSSEEISSDGGLEDNVNESGNSDSDYNETVSNDSDSDNDSGSGDSVNDDTSMDTSSDDNDSVNDDSGQDGTSLDTSSDDNDNDDWTDDNCYKTQYPDSPCIDYVEKLYDNCGVPSPTAMHVNCWNPCDIQDFYYCYYFLYTAIGQLCSPQCDSLSEIHKDTSQWQMYRNECGQFNL